MGLCKHHDAQKGQGKDPACRLDREWINNSPVEKDLGMSVYEKFRMISEAHWQLRKPTTSSATSKEEQPVGQGGVSAPQLCSLDTPPGTLCAAWGPQHKRDVNLFEQVQREVTK